MFEISSPRSDWVIKPRTITIASLVIRNYCTMNTWFSVSHLDDNESAVSLVVHLEISAGPTVLQIKGIVRKWAS